MCKITDVLFNQLPDGQNEKMRQYRDIFPNGAAAYFATLQPYDLDSLVTIIEKSPYDDLQAALDGNKVDTPISQALNQFRNHFTALSNQEKIFNPKHLLHALECFNKQYKKWGDYCWEKRDLFLCQIVGYMQRFQPVCYSKILNPIENETFFPLGPDSGLGFDFIMNNDGNKCSRSHTNDCPGMLPTTQKTKRHKHNLFRFTAQPT